MNLETLKNALPDYARDLKLNLASLAAEAGLSDQQRNGTFVAAALASRNPEVVEAVLNEFGSRMDPVALTAAKAAAAIMSMNNVYYRFTHLVAAQEYRSLPAKLRMSVMARPGVDKADFELWSLAVSAINGCGMCMDSHEKILREAGVAAETIQAAVRIAATVQAVAVALAAEQRVAT